MVGPVSILMYKKLKEQTWYDSSLQNNMTSQGGQTSESRKNAISRKLNTLQRISGSKNFPCQPGQYSNISDNKSNLHRAEKSLLSENLGSVIKSFKQ